jgi:hypothetical protein
LYSLDSCQTAKHTSSPNGPNWYLQKWDAARDGQRNF